MLIKTWIPSLLNSCLAYKTSLAFIIFVSLIAGCGKRTPPLPPIEKVPQRTEISALQQSNRIVVSWNLPIQNTSSSSVINISQVDVYRLVEKLDSPQNITEEEFSANATLIGSLPLKSADFAAGRMSYTDVLEFAGQSARLRYAVRFVNASGQKAAFSNFLTIEPTARVAKQPFLKSTDLTQDRIVLKWDSPTENVDGSKPANILGYNIYRIEGEKSDYKILNSSPLNKTEYVDNFFEFEKQYKYFVRAVSVGSNGQPIESSDSNRLEIIPKDTFPPAPPESLTIAATPTSISIFFATNTEKDIAGYRVFRSTDQNLPKNDWQSLTAEILQTNTLQDTQVESGKTYYYYVTAVDKFGNISQPSDVVSETVP